MKTEKPFIKDKKGQSIIEFALVLPVLLLVLFGITEFGRAIMVTNILNTAAREGAREGVESGDTTSVVEKANAVLQAANLTGAVVDPVYDLTERTVTVTVTYDFEVLSGGILESIIPTPFTLTGRTVMRLKDSG
jgi:Flp pilus assembly protein TadG